MSKKIESTYRLNDEDYISQGSACEYLGISAYKFRRLVDAGEIHVAMKYGVRNLFKLDDINKLERHINKSQPIKIFNFESGSYNRK